MIEANRKAGRVTRWQVHVGPRPVPDQDQAQAPKPKWLKQRAKDLTYWRKVYDSGADLDGMPLAFAERIFEDSRQTPPVVDKPADNKSDLCLRDRLTRKG